MASTTELLLGELDTLSNVLARKAQTRQELLDATLNAKLRHRMLGEVHAYTDALNQLDAIINAAKQ